MTNPSIHELDGMSTEDTRNRIRERIMEMYVVTGDCEIALMWMWRDLSSKQIQEVK